jgi:hypothetical protein
MNAEIQNQKIKDAQAKINGLKYALGYARYNRTDEIAWLETELSKAEQKLAKLQVIA